MKPYSRADRVGGHLQRALSEVLRRQIKDPRLEPAVITGVQMSADLKHARVYYVTSSGARSREEVAAGFEKAKGFVKKVLARQLGLRYMPEILFLYDTSFDYGSHIEQLLRKLDTEK